MGMILNLKNGFELGKTVNVAVRRGGRVLQGAHGGLCGQQEIFCVLSNKSAVEDPNRVTGYTLLNP
jgi:hypothetical protein